MSQNQQNKPYEASLNQCRSEINTIDEQILDLLSKRIRVVEKVREIKEEKQEKFFIKSGREGDMMKDLLKKADKLLPPSTIISIWRKIITSSNMLEQSLKIALHNPKNSCHFDFLLREYYSELVPIITHDSVNNIVSEIEKNNAQIAIFEIPQISEEINNNEEWWINLANNKSGLKVFAQIPAAKYKNNENQIKLAALAIKEVEKSKEDNSLFCIELDKSISRAQLQNSLKECNIKAKIIKTSYLKQVNDIVFYLIETEGFYDEESDEIANLKESKIRPFIKFLGCYPSTIVI